MDAGVWWLLVIAAFGAAVCYPLLLYRPPALFVVRLRAGEARTRRGTVTAAFLAVLEEAAERYGVRSGEIRGVRRGRRIALWFSRGSPGRFQQVVRNWWLLHGWVGRPRGGGNAA